MEDRLAKSLRAAHDRHVQHLASEHASHANPGEHHEPAPAPTPAPVHRSAGHDEPVDHPMTADHHVAAEHHADRPAPHEVHRPQPQPAPARVAAATVPARAHVVPARPAETERPAFVRRFGWQSGHVSIVGTLVLSVLISTGLFSLQLISKWRRPKPAEAEVKAANLDQPLMIATDDAQPTDDAASTPSAPSRPSAAAEPQAAQPVATADESAQRGLDEFFASSKNGSASTPAGETKAGRAPYAPDPIDLSNATVSATDRRAVMAPEAAAEHGVLPGGLLPGPQPMASPSGLPSGLPAQTAGGPADLDPSAAAAQAPLLPHGMVERPAEASSNKPADATQPNRAYGLSEHAGAAQTPIRPLSPPTAQAALPSPYPNSANSMNANPTQWNRTATGSNPVAPGSATQVAELPDAARNSLDAPGPMIVPGRSAPGAPNMAVATNMPGAPNMPGVLPVSGMTGRSSDVMHADASPQLRDLTQSAPPADPTQAVPAPGSPAQVGNATAQPPAGTDPVYGLFDHRKMSAADAGHTEAASGLADLDRKKVMSFQFRNAPWTVVLQQFATETHLELRMQAVPQGVFNRWDSARYSPSQTLAILNSELARTGCQLRLEGSVLRVTALPAATTQTSSPTRSSVVPAAWFAPPSSGLAPTSGR